LYSYKNLTSSWRAQSPIGLRADQLELRTVGFVYRVMVEEQSASPDVEADDDSTVGQLRSESGEIVGNGVSRGLAEGVGFVFALGILTLFVGGSMFAGATLLENTAENAKQEQIEFEAERVAWAFEDVDRSVRASDSDNEISEVVDLPDEIAGDTYNLTITPTPTGGFVNMSVRGSGVETSVEFYTDTLVKDRSVTGGELRVLRRQGETRITVEKVDDPS
jgi:hypothetical protein